MDLAVPGGPIPDEEVRPLAEVERAAIRRALGNLKGVKRPEGNPFEPYRSAPYPLPLGALTAPLLVNGLAASATQAVLTLAATSGHWLPTPVQRTSPAGRDRIVIAAASYLI
jgi:hypothetical protein